MEETSQIKVDADGLSDLGELDDLDIPLGVSDQMDALAHVNGLEDLQDLQELQELDDDAATTSAPAPTGATKAAVTAPSSSALAPETSPISLPPTPAP